MLLASPQEVRLDHDTKEQPQFLAGKVRSQRGERSGQHSCAARTKFSRCG